MQFPDRYKWYEAKFAADDMPDWIAGRFISSTQQAPYMRLLTFEVEVSRERVPLRNAYKAAGQRMAVRVNGGEKRLLTVRGWCGWWHRVVWSAAVRLRACRQLCLPFLERRSAASRCVAGGTFVADCSVRRAVWECDVCYAVLLVGCRLQAAGWQQQQYPGAAWQHWGRLSTWLKRSWSADGTRLLLLHAVCCCLNHTNSLIMYAVLYAACFVSGCQPSSP